MGNIVYTLIYKVLGFITNNQFYLKSTQQGLNLHQGALVKAFPGAEDYILIEDELENPDLINDLSPEPFKALSANKIKSI